MRLYYALMQMQSHNYNILLTRHIVHLILYLKFYNDVKILKKTYINTYYYRNGWSDYNGFFLMVKKTTLFAICRNLFVVVFIGKDVC